MGHLCADDRVRLIEHSIQELIVSAPIRSGRIIGGRFKCHSAGRIQVVGLLLRKGECIQSSGLLPLRATFRGIARLLGRVIFRGIARLLGRVIFRSIARLLGRVIFRGIARLLGRVIFRGIVRLAGRVIFRNVSWFFGSFFFPGAILLPLTEGAQETQDAAKSAVPASACPIILAVLSIVCSSTLRIVPFTVIS